MVVMTGKPVYFCVESCAVPASDNGHGYREAARTHIVRGADHAWRVAGKVDPVTGEDL